MISWFQRKTVLLPVVIGFVLIAATLWLCTTTTGDQSLLLKKSLSELKELKRKLSDVQNKLSATKTETQTTLYIVTPTYSRHTQQADLIRLSNTLKLVPNLHWIVVEDSVIPTPLVASLLEESKLDYTHLHTRTARNLVRSANDPRWKKHRGVDQRNLALKWLRGNLDVNRDGNGVVYFADDDNTYHQRLFAEMRDTRELSVWPVALVGGLRWEGPICRDGKVVKFFTVWEPTRKFPLDMAAFAINLTLLLKKNNVFISPEVKRGFLESDFLERLGIKLENAQGKADNCKKILVWHTQTAEPNMKQELKFNANGQASDPSVII